MPNIFHLRRLKLIEHKLESMVNKSVIRIKALFGGINYYSSAFDIQHASEGMIDELKKMIADSQYKDTALRAMDALYHTLNKEVKFCHSAEDAVHKKNAAKVRKKEYQQMADKTISQIYQDIFSIFHVEDAG